MDVSDDDGIRWITARSNFFVIESSATAIRYIKCEGLQTNLTLPRSCDVADVARAKTVMRDAGCSADSWTKSKPKHAVAFRRPTVSESDRRPGTHLVKLCVAVRPELLMYSFVMKVFMIGGGGW